MSAIVKRVPRSLYCRACSARLVCRSCYAFYKDAVRGACKCGAASACPDCDLVLVEVVGVGLVQPHPCAALSLASEARDERPADDADGLKWPPEADRPPPRARPSDEFPPQEEVDHV